MATVSKNGPFSSSQFLSLQTVKGKEKLEWKGSLQNLQSFLRVFLTSHGYSDGQAEAVWSAPQGFGVPYKATFSDFVCTWYAEKFTLLLQGKRGHYIRTELNKILNAPIMVNEDVFSVSESPKIVKEKQEKRKKVEQTPLVEEKTALTAGQVCNGMVRGKDVKLVIASKLREWTHRKSRIVVVTPFLDSEGLSFLVSCIPEITNMEIYVRKDCQWDSNIEQVINQSKLSHHWIVKHIHAVNKTPSFHAKFLAGVEENTVDLVLTSCNVTKDHMESNQLETLERKALSCEEFNDNWMKPIQKICEGNIVKFVDVDELSHLMEGTSLNE